jgi:hypothetical protein
MSVYRGDWDVIGRGSKRRDWTLTGRLVPSALQADCVPFLARRPVVICYNLALRAMAPAITVARPPSTKRRTAALLQGRPLTRTIIT